MNFKRPHSIFEYFIVLFKKQNNKNIQIQINEQIQKYIIQYEIIKEDYLILTQQFWLWFCDKIAPIYLRLKNLNEIILNYRDYKHLSDFVQPKFDISAINLNLFI